MYLNKSEKHCTQIACWRSNKRWFDKSRGERFICSPKLPDWPLGPLLPLDLLKGPLSTKVRWPQHKANHSLHLLLKSRMSRLSLLPNTISCRAHGKTWLSVMCLNATALRVCNSLYNINSPLNNPQVRDCFSNPIQTTLNLGVDLLSGLCGVVLTHKSLDREDNYM